ncbi:MAG: hypothetical protein AAB801_00565 [Patescibacteria group bacterium]
MADPKTGKMKNGLCSYIKLNKTRVSPKNLPDAKTNSLPGIETLKLGLISTTMAVEIFKKIGRRSETIPERTIQILIFWDANIKANVTTAKEIVTGYRKMILF